MRTRTIKYQRQTSSTRAGLKHSFTLKTVLVHENAGEISLLFKNFCLVKFEYFNNGNKAP